MEALFFRVLTLSVTCGAAVGLALLLLPRLKRRYAARTAYFLWLLLALRLVTPFAFTLPDTTALTLTPPARSIQIPAGIREPFQTAHSVDGTVSSPVETAPPAESAAPVTQSSGDSAGEDPAGVILKDSNTIPLPLLLSAVWLAGAALTLAWQGGGYLAARRSLLKRAQPAGEEERALLAELSGGKAPALYRAPVDTPMMLGIFRPVLLLPMEDLPAGELELALRHELTHLRRRDVAYKTLMAAACVLHWFNPLVWRMAREAGQTVEVCCDADVVAGQSEEYRRAYGLALLHTAAGRKDIPFTTCFGGGKEQLKERIADLFSSRRNGPAAVCLFLVAALAMGLVVSCAEERNVYSGYWHPFELEIPAELGINYGVTVSYFSESLEYVLENGEYKELFTVRTEETGDFEALYGENGRDFEETYPGQGIYLDKKDGVSFYLTWPELADDDPAREDEGYMTALTLCKDITEKDFSFTKEMMPHFFYGRITDIGESSLTVEKVEQLYNKYRDRLGLAGEDTAGEEPEAWPVDPDLVSVRLRDPEKGRTYPELMDALLEEAEQVYQISKMEWQGEGWRGAQLEAARLYGDEDALCNRVFLFCALDGMVRYIVETDASTADPTLPDETYYVNTTYGFELTLPGYWEGRYTVKEAEGRIVFLHKDGINENRRLFTLYVTDRAEFIERFGELKPEYEVPIAYLGEFPEELRESLSDKELIKVMGTCEGRVFWLYPGEFGDISFDVRPEEVQEENQNLLAWVGSIGPENFEFYGTGASLQNNVYTNLAYGFSIQLPESWDGKVKAVMDSDDHVTFYCPLSKGDAYLCDIGVYTEEKTELLGRERFLGQGNGVWVYAYFGMHDSPLLAESSAEERAFCETLLGDREKITGVSWAWQSRPAP